MRIAKSALILCVGLFMCSCSYPHPLQDDVTGLPLSDIVRKIVCEARDALDKQLGARNLAWRRGAFKETKKDIEKLKDKVLKPRENETKELKKHKDKLNSRLEINNKEVAEVKAAYAAKVEELDVIKGREAHILKQRSELMKDIVVYTRAVEGHNRDLVIAGKRVDAATRAANAHSQDLARYYSHAMAFGFRFRIKEKNGLTATASWKLPLIFNSNPGMLTVGTSGSGLGDSKERLSERKVNLVATFEDLHGFDCSYAPAQAGRLRSLHYPIRGEIGIGEVMDQYFLLQDRAREDQENDGLKKFKPLFVDAKGYTDTITFTTILSGSVSPSIVLNPTLRETFNGSLGFSGSREDLHEVSLSLQTTGGAKVSDKITKVQIIPEDILSIR
jgi:hypothetical protein